jgi:hypothetical protein
MRIYIKETGGKTFFIPVPLSVACFCLNFSSFIIKKSQKYIPESSMEYIDCIDFKVLSKSLRELKHYRGLELVNVQSSDGTIVKITI